MDNENVNLQEWDDNKKELCLLKEIISSMEKIIKNMASCDNITDMEYKIFGLYIQELENRAMKLEIEINGCILEEV